MREKTLRKSIPQRSDDELFKNAVRMTELAHIELMSGKDEEELAEIKDGLMLKDSREFARQDSHLKGVRRLARSEQEAFLGRQLTLAPVRKTADEPCVVLVAGVPGVGKSTLLRNYRNSFPDERVEVIEVGEQVVEAAKARHLVPENAVNLKGLGDADRRRLVRSVLEDVSERITDPDTTYLVTAHSTIGNPDKGLIPQLSEEGLHTLRPDAIVVVDSGTGTILRQRREDARKHRSLGKFLLRGHRQAEKTVAELTAEAAEIPCYTINAQTESGAESLNQLIKEIRGRREHRETENPK